MSKTKQKPDIPTAEQLFSEMKRLRAGERFRKAIVSTVLSLFVTAALAFMLSSLVFPVLRVTGTSMTPTLQNDEILLCNKLSGYGRGDLIAFYYNNRILLKRVIGVAGDVIDLQEDGTVYLNGDPLDEPYLSEPALGECNIELPYQVPDNRIFVMGDHRAVSIDSRSTSVGCIADENVIGKVAAVVWPPSSFRRQ